MSSSHPVRDFYKDKTIFLTGATGFLGRSILSKLLRDLANVKKIYILMRKKKDVCVRQRMQELIGSIDPVLTFELANNPALLDLISPINGDMAQSDLGITDIDMRALKDEVDVVISCAADIGFHRPLSSIIRTNLRGIIDLFRIAASCRTGVTFVHVSTAYTNVEDDLNYESVQDMPEDIGLLLQMIDRGASEAELKNAAPSLEHKLTSYAWSKSLSEFWLKQNCQSIPTIIIRPALITGALNDPAPGWVHGKAGPVGLMYALMRGTLRTLPLYEQGLCNLIPVDTVCRSIIAAAWWVHETSDPHQGPLVMYVDTSSHAPLYGAAFFQYLQKFMTEQVVDFSTSLRLKLISMPKYGSTKWRFQWNLLHKVPVRLMPSSTRKKQFLRLLHQFETVMPDFAAVTNLRCWFVSRQLQLMNDAIAEDKDKFGHNLHGIDWPQYLQSSLLGTVKYL